MFSEKLITIACDGDDLGVQCRNTYESLCEALIDDFWFVVLPKNENQAYQLNSWTKNKNNIIIANHNEGVGGYVDRNIFFEYFPKNKVYTHIISGVIASDAYFQFCISKLEDKTVGAVGGIGYSAHGNWESIEGNMVLPKHLCHVLDDALWSWKNTGYRYGPPFQSLPGGHYDHQMHLHQLGLNLWSGPSESIIMLPEGYDIMENNDESVKYLEDTWRDKIEFLFPSDVMETYS